jgi:cytochrome c
MRFLVPSAALLLAGLGPTQAQDAAAGEKVFAQCRACHQVGETAKNAVGPVLNGLFGRKAKIPGTKMIYAGVKDEQRVTDLVAYLKQFDAAGKKTP